MDNKNQNDKCENCQFPSVAQQATNLTVSLFNVLTQAFKTGKTLASQEDVEKRVNICQACPYLKNNRCSECGCFIALKAGLQNEKCPKGKW